MRVLHENIVTGRFFECKRGLALTLLISFIPFRIVRKERDKSSRRRCSMTVSAQTIGQNGLP